MNAIEAQQKTAQLLSRQADILKDAQRQKQSQKHIINYGLPEYKSSTQIKQENFNLRHAYSNNRILKMHSVMPRMLQQITEPEPHLVPDYSIDVKKRTQQVIDDRETHRQSQQRELEKVFDSSSSDSEQSCQSVKEEMTQKTSLVIQEDLNTNKPSTRGKPWSRKGSAPTTRASRARILANREKVIPIPQGAQVKIDDEGLVQITKIERGQDPQTKSLRELLRHSILTKVDGQAKQKLNEMQRKFSMLKSSNDIKFKTQAKIMLEKAQKIQQLTHTMVSKRPHDKVHLINIQNPELTGNKIVPMKKTVGHGHFVKMSYEQLPNEMKDLLNENQNSNRTINSQFHCTSISTNQTTQATMKNSHQQLLARKRAIRPNNNHANISSNSSLNTTGAVDVTATSTTQLLTRKDQNHSARVIHKANDHFDGGKKQKAASTDRKKLTELKSIKSNSEGLTRLQLYKSANHSVGVSSTILNNTTHREIASALGSSMDTIKELEDKEAYNLSNKQKLHHQFYSNITTSENSRGEKGNTSLRRLIPTKEQRKNKTNSLFSMKSKKSRSRSSKNSLSLGVGQTMKQLQKRQSVTSQDGIHTMQEQNDKNIKHSSRPSLLNSSRAKKNSVIITSQPKPYKFKRPVSISNLSEKTLNKFTEKQNQRSRQQSNDEHKLKTEIMLNSIPDQIGENQFYVRQRFHYVKPMRYQIQFAKTAIFDKGCLTCGHENSKVENYGDRHCCSTCIKSLQNVDGDPVTLRTAHNGRFIKGTAWQWSKPIKDKVDIENLRIRGGHKCHATFAGEKGEIIVLLDEVDENYIYSY